MNYFSDLVLVLDSFLSRDKSGRRTIVSDDSFENVN